MKSKFNGTTFVWDYIHMGLHFQTHCNVTTDSKLRIYHHTPYYALNCSP